MLALDRIEQLMKSREIEISHAYAPDESGNLIYQGDLAVDVENPDAASTRALRDNFFGDRLSLTLGPIAKSHNSEYARTRPLFNDRAGYIDVRANNDELIIEPGEILSVATNERIKLGPTIAAYVLPRLRNVDSGLLYAPSYIDPYWDGILQALIVNLTDKRQKLSLGEKIAICRFYEVDGTVPGSVRDAFPRKSHHFGQSWPKVLDEGAEPFPVRPVVTLPSENTASAALRRVRAFWTRNGARFLTAGSLVTLGGVVISVAIAVNDVADLSSDVTRIDAELTSLAGTRLPAAELRLDEITTAAATSGSGVVSVAAGEVTAFSTFTVARPRGATTTVWAATDGTVQGVSKIEARLDPAPNGVESVLIIEVSLAEPGPARNIPVKWLLVP